MLIPSRTKYRKQHRGRMRGMSKGGKFLAFGTYGLQALECCWLTANQIEAARKVITRTVKRAGKMWIRVFPDKPRTAKSAEVGMGGGRGALSHFVAVVESGRMLFEVDGVTEQVAREALRLASHKLPIKTRFVKR